MSDSRPQPPSGAGMREAGGKDAVVADAVARRQAGRLDEAAELFTHALRDDPENAGLLLLAGETLFRLGRLHAAYDAIAAALSRTSDLPDGLFLLGRILTALGKPADAVAAFERVLERRADHAPAWRFMAPALFALGRRTDAEAAFARADALQPQAADLYNQLGIELLAFRRAVEAEAAFRHAIARAPKLAAAHQNLGAALAAQERLPEAIAAERRAAELSPRSAAALNNLAVFEGAGGDFDAARRAVAQALQSDPRHTDSLHTLASIRLEEGDAQAAIALLERARSATPQHVPSPALLLARNYVMAHHDQGAFADAKAVGRALRPPGPSFSFAAHNRDPERRLRIGYVSGDFRRHSCASFIRPLFAAHHAETVELFAYSENPVDDEITTEIRGRTHAWRPIAGLGDGAVAETIHRDGIDILVDLSGYMAANRLPVFALRPAPVQVTWLGYPDTTGLETIDYRITDARADPPGASDRFYTEHLWRLPEGFLVFAGDPSPPGADRAPLQGRPIVFGSFNHLPKVTPDVVATWAEILNATPDARLLLKAKRLGDPLVRERYIKLFAGHGIAADRLELVGWQVAPADHLGLYGRVDIGLDPFPYNGTTTTCEALWMGVPVVTLAGERHAGRVGTSLLGALGLDDLVASSREDYVDRAVALARDRSRLHDLQVGLRERMQASPLCDATGFARRLEAAYREMWRKWCAGGA